MNLRHFIPAVVGFVIIAYPLSFGPVVRYNTLHPGWFTPSWQEIYRPLGWLCDRCPPIDSAMLWYIDLWIYLWRPPNAVGTP